VSDRLRKEPGAFEWKKGKEGGIKNTSHPELLAGNVHIMVWSYLSELLEKREYLE